MDGLRQRRQDAVRRAIELHEDQVPQLDEALAGIVRELALARFRPEVVMDFRARPARPGLAHLPEIVRFVHAENTALRDARHFLPELFGVIVLAKNSDVKLVFRQREILGEQFPRESDGLALEIVAEGKIAQHLEKGVMPARVADVIEIVVFTARTHALLRRGGARVVAPFEAGKDVLELIHARVGEQQRRVVGWNQRRTANNFVAMRREVIEKLLADFVPCHVSSL